MASDLGLEVTTFPMNLEDAREDVTRLAEQIHERHRREVAQVAGRSNVVPMLIGSLGGPAMSHLDEDDYQNLFILSLTDGKTHLVRARYGSPNPDSEE